MKKIQKFVIVVLSIIMMTTVFWGCTGNNDDVSGELSEYVKAQKEKWYIGDNLSLSWYVGINWWSYTKPWTSYPVLKEVSQITGVVPKVSIATDSDGSKLGLMMSTNRLPDYITLDPDDPMVDKLITGGYVYSYDELIEKYCTDFEFEIDETFRSYTAYESTDEEYADLDGKLFGLNCFFVKDEDDLGHLTFNVRQDIYEEIGSPDMSTTEGFYNALKEVKKRYPDMIPLVLGDSWYRWVFEEAFGCYNYYVTEEGGQTSVKMRAKDPKFLEALLFLRKLYSEKLIDQDVFTRSSDSLDTILAAGNVFCYPTTFWGLDVVNASLEATKKGSHFIAVKPLAGGSMTDETVKFQGTSRRGWLTTLISKNCKDPETAIKFARYMWSVDGNLLVCYGHENEHYYIEDGYIYRTEEVIEARKNDLTKFENETGIFTQRLFSYPYYEEGESTDPDRRANEAMAGKYCYDSTVFTYKMDPPSDTAESTISTKVWAKFSTMWPSMVMASSDEKAEEILRDTLADMENVGLSRLEKYWTQRYIKNIEKFGDPFAVKE